MQEMILPLAAGILDVTEQDALLTALCRAAETAWRARLRAGVCPEDCREVFCCAAAFFAVAEYVVSRSANQVRSFTAGEISVKTGVDGDAAALAAALRETAERLMTPYARSCAFAFKGVRG